MVSSHFKCRKIFYMIDVKKPGKPLDQPFGNFVEKEAILKIPNAKPYGRFSFAIKCFPDAGNYVDLQSPIATHTFDFPVVYCPTPSNNPISRPQNEPTSLKISFKELPDAPAGHRYEIEVASDPEFSSGLDRRTIQGNELDTVMTGRVPEEIHYVRIRMIGPEDDATVIASSWTDTVIIEATPPPIPEPPTRYPIRRFQNTIDRIKPIKAPAASAAASQTSGDLPVASQSCQHSSAIPKQAQKASKPQGKPELPLPKAPHARTPMMAYSTRWMTLSETATPVLGNSPGDMLDT